MTDVVPVAGAGAAPFALAKQAGTALGGGDAILITVDGLGLAEVKALTVTRSLERFPSSFSVTISEPFPDETALRFGVPGAAVTILLGADLVLTGYVDRITMAADPRNHSVVITGRSRCQDFVDCSAALTTDDLRGGQMSGVDALDIARRLAKPFDITVRALVDQPSDIQSGETGGEFLARTSTAPRRACRAAWAVAGSRWTSPSTARRRAPRAPSAQRQRAGEPAADRSITRACTGRAMSDAPAEDPNEKRSQLALVLAAGAYAEMSAARIVADATLIALVKAGAIPHNMANDLISSAAAALKADTASMPPASRELVEKALVALLGRLQAIAGAASAVPLSEGVH